MNIYLILNNFLSILILTISNKNISSLINHLIHFYNFVPILALTFSVLKNNPDWSQKPTSNQSPNQRPTPNKDAFSPSNLIFNLNNLADQPIDPLNKTVH